VVVSSSDMGDTIVPLQRGSIRRPFPVELLDIIVGYIDTSLSGLLVCKRWHFLLMKRRLESLELSANMLLQFSKLSTISWT
jgi:hypothetical protein